MLDAFSPFALVDAAISPQHLTESMALIFHVIALIDVATSPSEHAFAMFEVISIVSFVGVAVLWVLATLPLAFAFFLPLVEVSDIDLSGHPLVLSFAMGLSISVLPMVYISVLKGIGACSMLQAHLPLAFISISIGPGMDPVSMSLRILPFTNV